MSDNKLAFKWVTCDSSEIGHSSIMAIKGVDAAGNYKVLPVKLVVYVREGVSDWIDVMIEDDGK